MKPPRKCHYAVFIPRENSVQIYKLRQVAESIARREHGYLRRVRPLGKGV